MRKALTAILGIHKVKQAYSWIVLLMTDTEDLTPSIPPRKNWYGRLGYQQDSRSWSHQQGEHFLFYWKRARARWLNKHCPKFYFETSSCLSAGYFNGSRSRESDLWSVWCGRGGCVCLRMDGLHGGSGSRLPSSHTQILFFREFGFSSTSQIFQLSFCFSIFPDPELCLCFIIALVN